nr:hypothetical protein CFP56_02527 [Quercus suber]
MVDHPRDLPEPREAYVSKTKGLPILKHNVTRWDQGPPGGLGIELPVVGPSETSTSTAYKHPLHQKSHWIVDLWVKNQHRNQQRRGPAVLALVQDVHIVRLRFLYVGATLARACSAVGKKHIHPVASASVATSVTVCYLGSWGHDADVGLRRSRKLEPLRPALVLSCAGLSYYPGT